MTFEPPQNPQFQNPQFQNPQFQNPQFQPSPVTSSANGLLAPVAPPSTVRMILGAVALVAALVLIVCAFLTWVSGSAKSSQDLGAMSTSVEMNMRVSGMGAGDAEIKIIDAPDLIRDRLEATVAKEEMAFSDSADEKADSPGVWTLLLGVLIAAGAVLLLVGRFSGVGAIVVTVGGAAATVAAIVFVADPTGAVGMKDLPARSDFSVGFGLWLTLFGALAALVAGATAVLSTMRPDLLGGNRAPAPGVPGQPQPFGGPQFGQQPDQQFGRPQFGQQAPGQPGYGQEPGPGGHPQQPPFGQQGFPPRQ